VIVADRDRIAEFKEVAELMPDDPVVRFGLAGAYLEAGQAESAILEYEETIRLKPDYSAAHRGLGRALERAGRREEAQAAYRTGLEVATPTPKSGLATAALLYAEAAGKASNLAERDHLTRQAARLNIRR